MKAIQAVPLKYLIVLFSICGVTVLYLLSLLIQPVLVPLEDIALYDGKQVIIQGCVNKYSTNTYGSQFITIHSTNHSANYTEVIVFTEYPVTINTGDIIQAIGTVQQYKNDWELMTTSDKDILIIKKWNETITPLWELAEYPRKFTGLHVNITGMIDRMYDSYFYLIDEPGNYSLLVEYNSYLFPGLYEGQDVCIIGTFEYEASQLRYQVDANQIYFLDEAEVLT